MLKNNYNDKTKITIYYQNFSKKNINKYLRDDACIILCEASVHNRKPRTRKPFVGFFGQEGGKII